MSMTTEELKEKDRQRGVKCSLHLPGDLLGQLDEHVVALEEHLDLEVSRNQLICKAIREYLVKHEVRK